MIFKKVIKRKKRMFTIQELAYLDEFFKTEIKYCNDTIDKYKLDGHTYSKMYVADAKLKKSCYQKLLTQIYKL